MNGTTGRTGTPPASPPPLHRIVEALLFVGGPPLSAARAAEAVAGLTAEQLAESVDDLNRLYRRQRRPYAVRLAAGGYVLALRGRFRPLVERLHRAARLARLSPAALDVLAVIAYRQPVTKQEVDGLRGAESGALLRQLVRRGLVDVLRVKTGGRSETTYATTKRFLELFGLASIDDLPQTQDAQSL